MKEKEIYTNNVITLDRIPPGKPIVVEFGGEIVGIVCKHKPNGIWNGTRRIQFIEGLHSLSYKLLQLIKSWQKDGYTSKTQLSPGEPLQEIIADDSWIHIDDIKSTDLVLVKKSGNIIGMVQFDAGEYFIATSINDIEEDLRFTTTLRVLVEEGQKKGYSFYLLVNDTQ